MDLRAEWAIAGVVTERRELKAKDTASSWRGWVCKVATIGLTAEVVLTQELFHQVGEGQAVEFRGRFELQDKFVKLVAQSVKAQAVRA